MIRNGMATKVSAMTTPAVVNGSVMPKVLSSHDPTSPRLPNASRSAMPPTTGGRTMGRVVNARRRLRPGNATLAKTHASGTPRTSPTAVAESEAIRESFSASIVSGAVSALTASPQGDRTTSASRGRMKKAAPIAASATTRIGTRSRLTLGSGGREKSEACQRRLAGGRHDVRDEGVGHSRVRGALNHHYWISRDHVVGGRDLAARHLVAGCCDVCRVDDSCICLAELDLADYGSDARLKTLRGDCDTRRF